MIKKTPRNKIRKRRHFRIRTNVSGTSVVPRLSIFRSNKAIYAQAIDDVNGVTIASSSTLALKIEKNNIEAAKQVGEAIGKLLVDKKIEKIVFDRSGYLYHGRVKALADGAREAGLKF